MRVLTKKETKCFVYNSLDFLIPLGFCNFASMASKKVDALKLKQWQGDLTSSEQHIAMSAIHQIEESGNMHVFPLLIETLRKSPLIQVEQAILKLIADIQSEEKVETLMQFIQDEKSPTLRLQLLTCVWNSKQDFSPFLAEIVSLSTEGDFMQALECLTILENMSGPFAENQLLEAQLYLKEYVENLSKENDQRKAQIISDIALFVKEQNEGIDADLLLD